jgi:hypothetical protein
MYSGRINGQTSGISYTTRPATGTLLLTEYSGKCATGFKFSNLQWDNPGQISLRAATRLRANGLAFSKAQTVLLSNTILQVGESNDEFFFKTQNAAKHKGGIFDKILTRRSISTIDISHFTGELDRFPSKVPKNQKAF